MVKVRKMLGSADSDYIKSLMSLIETQSKETIAEWCLNYSENVILPIFNKYCPNDVRVKNALDASRDWFDGKKKLAEVKDIILNQCHQAARELDDNPAAQAAARCCGQAAAVFHTPTHSLGLAFYGCAALAYDELGIDKSKEEYDKYAAQQCKKMEDALAKIAVKDEKNPAKIKWYC
ncbi:MAG: putative immunity protein [Anaerorhabdus sp.]